MYAMGKIGIGVTVHNRNATAERTVCEIKKFAPDGARVVVVDDASKVPFADADFRFNVNVGISRAKNKCLELLDDCEHIFLFDDDCFPIMDGWERPYIDSGMPHLSFTFDRLHNGRQNGNKLIEERGAFTVYNNPCGCMVYLRRDAIDAVGGYNTAYDTYGYEHVELSRRIYNKGLIPHPYMDVTGSLALFHSFDYYGDISSSVTVNRAGLLRHNLRVFSQNRNSSHYCPYKPEPKKQHGDVILTAYFNYAKDPQRRKKWAADASEIMTLADSCIRKKKKLFIFTDCLIDSIGSQYVEFVNTQPTRTHSPNVYRWIVYNEWMQSNDFERIWMVDSTDVELLKDPFKIIKKGYLYCGDECDVTTDNSWMRNTQERYLKINDYRQVIYDNREKRLINCGLVGGDKEMIYGFVEQWADLHKKNTAGLMKTTDMAVFNYLARKYYNDKIVHGEKINTKFKHFETKNKVAIWKHK